MDKRKWRVLAILPFVLLLIYFMIPQWTSQHHSDFETLLEVPHNALVELCDGYCATNKAYTSFIENFDVPLEQLQLNSHSDARYKKLFQTDESEHQLYLWTPGIRRYTVLEGNSSAELLNEANEYFQALEKYLILYSKDAIVSFMQENCTKVILFSETTPIDFLALFAGRMSNNIDFAVVKCPMLGREFVTLDFPVLAIFDKNSELIFEVNGTFTYQNMVQTIEELTIMKNEDNNMPAQETTVFVVTLWIIAAYFGPQLWIKMLQYCSKYIDSLTSDYAITLPIQACFAIGYSRKVRALVFSLMLILGMYIYGVSWLSFLLLAISVNILRSSQADIVDKFRASALYKPEKEQEIADVSRFVKHIVDENQQESTLTFLSNAIEALSYSDIFVARRRKLYYFIVKRVYKWNMSETEHGIALCNFCGQMKGAYAKIGQHFSIRNDIIHPDICKTLESLKESTPPHPWEETVEILNERLGKDWRDQLVIVEGADPKHSASIGQVYFGKYQGKPVVCKVLHKKSTNELDADIKAMKVVATAARCMNIHLVNALDVIGTEIKEELDFRTESNNIQKLHFGKVEYPEVVASFEDLIILTIVKGSSLSDLAHNRNFTRNQRERVVKKLSRVIATQILEYGVFHADPHDGNVFYDIRSDTLSLIDFGQVQRLSSATKENLVNLLDHYRNTFRTTFIDRLPVSEKQSENLRTYLKLLEFPLPGNCTPFQALHSNLMGDGEYPAGGELPTQLVYVFVTFKYLTGIEKNLLGNHLPTLTLQSVGKIAEAIVLQKAFC